MKKIFNVLGSISVLLSMIFILTSQNIEAAQVGDSIESIFYKDPKMAQAIAAELEKDVTDILTIEDSEIEYLSIYNKDISDITGISVFKDLDYFEAGTNNIKEIPAEIGELTKLTDMSFKENNISKVPDEIGLLSNLEGLNLESNEIQELPESLGDLSSLERLLVSTNEIKELPDSISRLSSINNINIIENELTTLPATLGDNKSISFIDARKNKITHLPENIGDATNLHSLRLDNNQIELLPESLTNLSELLDFSILNNKLVKLPDDFGNLDKLKNLELKGNQLTSLPSSISKLSLLYPLDLTSNFLPNDVVSKLNSILPTTTIIHTGTKKLTLNNSNLEYNISSEDDINSIILEYKVSYDNIQSISNKHKLILDDYKDVADATVDLSDYVEDGEIIKDGILTAKVRATGTGVFPNNSENAITDDTIKLIFIKKDKTGFVEVNYVDKDNKKIIEPDLLSGIIGSSFEIKNKDIKGYELIDTKGATTGSYTDKKQSVTFIYKKISLSNPLPGEGEDDALPSAGLDNTIAIILIGLSTVLLGGYTIIKKYN